MREAAERKIRWVDKRGCRMAINLGEHIGLVCFHYRKKHGLTQGQLARRLHVTNATMSKLECGGVRNPGIATVVRIAQCLGLSLEQLLGINTREPDLHPEALRVACLVNDILRGDREDNWVPRPALRVIPLDRQVRQDLAAKAADPFQQSNDGQWT